jgi:hypothetical protein
MTPIKFEAVVGADGVIRPPQGIELPKGKVEVVVRSREARKPRRGPGALKGMISYMAPDFDAPLDLK